MIQSIDAQALIKQAAEYFRLCEAVLTRKRGRYRPEQAKVMGLLHRYRGLKVWVVYRVPDDLNDLNGLNCLNEQRSLPSGSEAWMRVCEPRSQSDPGKDRD
jgi:hypothetical protein